MTSRKSTRPVPPQVQKQRNAAVTGVQNYFQVSQRMTPEAKIV